jgi:hypothetical protein
VGALQTLSPFGEFEGALLLRLTPEDDRFSFEPEVTAKLAKLFYEVVVCHYGRAGVP